MQDDGTRPKTGRPRTGTTILCAICGTAFYVRLSRASLCCSRACCDQAKRDSTPKISRTCQQCSVNFLVQPYVVARGKGIYCSRACMDANHPTRHGEAIAGNPSLEYVTWTAIKRRCLNPRASDYPNYGGRGITICDAWRDSFEAFLANVGRRPSSQHSIDRIDNNGNYEPGNVRWATRREQANNMRTNRRLTFDGVTRTATEWARIVGMEPYLVHRRLSDGWSIERALNAPVRRRR